MSTDQVAQFLGLCVGAYVVYFAFSTIHLVLFHPLAKFPGPKFWAASRIPWTFHVIKGDLWQVLGRLHEVYGPVVRIAPDELTTTFPSAWKELYASRPLLLKDPYSQTPPLNGSHSLFTAEGDTHRRLRAVLSHSFSDKGLRGQACIIEKYADQFITRVRREADQSLRPNGMGAVDLTKLYGYAAFDTITDLSLGEPLCDGLKDMNEHAWVKNYFFHAKFSAIRTALSRFSPLDIILGLFLLGMTRSARQRNWRVITGALNRRLAQRKTEVMEEKRSDLLSPLIDRLDGSGSNSITRGELLSNGLAFVIAGTQLNTNVLSTATYLVLRHKEKWGRLVEEVRGRFSADGDIAVQTTQDLAYLDAVINETIRIRHPTPINLPRIVPRGGHVVSGQPIPGNVVIGINLQNIQNSSALWVKPREFHPERFLPAMDPRYDDRFNKDVKEAFAPFSTGPRNCVGNKLFFAQVRVLLARVAWNFDLVLLEDVGAQTDWLDQRAWFAFEPRPLLVKPVPRPST
ncbi:hypothetical protein DL769_009518 [Monosporascus sp. CRB-8-3]|nr:hypothetical protein DL769_009518 [Monosporascus sp. CRB-8-3]